MSKSNWEVQKYLKYGAKEKLDHIFSNFLTAIVAKYIESSPTGDQIR